MADSTPPVDGGPGVADGMEVPFTPKVDQGGNSSISLVLAVVALLAAMIVPIFFLFRTQKNEETKMNAADRAAEAKEAAAAAKKQAKLERGTGKKKKGALSRMKKGGSGLDADAAAAGGGGDDDEEEEEEAPKKVAEKKADQPAGMEEKIAAIEADRERLGDKETKRRLKDVEREAKQLAREEKERVEAEALAKAKQEEYDQWKDMFSVDDAGEEGEAAVEEEGLLERFIVYMKEQKVTVLEEIAAEFKLRVQDVIERVNALERMGHITGVIDDRGKFIYITTSEMEAVAKYVQRKGRVRISALAMESNKLIDLQPKKQEVVDDAEAEPEGEKEGGGAAAAG